jgi:hypothetical protein
VKQKEVPKCRSTETTNGPKDKEKGQRQHQQAQQGQRLSASQALPESLFSRASNQTRENKEKNKGVIDRGGMI